MAPITGTIPKTKVRNNSHVPQEAVTPTRRDMSSNLVTTSLDWVPVSEYNSRGNYTQSRKTSNNTSDQEYADLDNPNSFETGFGRFVPVRPQPRVLPLNGQHRDSIVAEHGDENAGPSSSYGLHPYAHPVPNGVGPHSNHTTAAVMIVNPTTPNAMSVNMSQPFNTSVNSNRKNLVRNLNTARNNFEGSSNNISSNNNLTTSNSRTGTKTVNLMNNVYDAAGSSNNLNESNQVHRESARALGEAIVAACPDATAVERRLGQIREYIRVTSSLVDTMRNSEDEDVIVRPISSQSMGSGYSENELWQNEIKNKMEISQQRLAALQQQQKRLLKYKAEAKQQLAEINHARHMQEMAAASHDNLTNIQNQSVSSNYSVYPRLYAANQIGVATTLPHSGDINHHQVIGVSQNMTSDDILSTNNRESNDFNTNAPNHEDRFSHRDVNLTNSEGTGAHNSESDDDDGLNERARQLTMELQEIRAKKKHMESLVRI